jgi:dTDP-glucose 4,6-dehydratase
MHVDDHCDALLALLTHPGVEGQTFNIGGGEELDVLTMTDAILGQLGKPRTLIRHVEDRPGHDRRYAVDASKLMRLTGWKPRVAFREGLRLTIDWYVAHPTWWRPIKAGEFRQYYERMYGRRKVIGEVSG